MTVAMTSRTSSAPAATGLPLGYLAVFALNVRRYALPRDLP